MVAKDGRCYNFSSLVPFEAQAYMKHALDFADWAFASGEERRKLEVFNSFIPLKTIDAKVDSILTLTSTKLLFNFLLHLLTYVP